MRQNLRREQDEAYNASLQADQQRFSYLTLYIIIYMDMYVHVLYCIKK